MIDNDCCRGCGKVLPNGPLNGLCPICLFRHGLVDDSSAVKSGPFMSGMHGWRAHWRIWTSRSAVCPEYASRFRTWRWSGTDDSAGFARNASARTRTGRLQPLGEIARGGMGAVLKGRDPDLGRDLAVKVLLESHRDKPDLIRRFIEEAQIGGQLQHPGIVPIYELGAFADRRPYFAMKLVKGRTLGEPAGRAGWTGCATCPDSCRSSSPSARRSRMPTPAA